MPPRGLRRNFGWTLVGSVVYNSVQWVLVILLARLGTAEMVGQFAYAQAVAAPVFLTVGMNLRVVRATDVERLWLPAQYSTLRLTLNALSVSVALAVALVAGLRGAGLAVLIAICLSKSAEATSQMLYGHFQARERLDLVSRSMIMRAALGSTLFLAALVAFGGVVEACVGLAVGWTLTYWLHDRPAEGRLLHEDARERVALSERRSTTGALARTAAPLGLDAGVGSLATNTPRYSVAHMLGTTALGNYAALAYVSQMVTMVTGTLADTVIGRLAKLAATRDLRAFTRLLGVLVVFGVGVSVVAALMAWLVGEPIIDALLGEGYSDQDVLVTLMAGAGLVTLQRCLGRGLHAGRRFREVLIVDTVTLLATVLAAAVLIPRYDLVGAAATTGIGFGVGAVVAGVMLAGMLRDIRRASTA